MDALNTFVLLMFISVLLVGLAQKVQIPYPITLVLGGSIIGFMPGLTPFDFDPRTLLVIVLPPILFYASYNLAFKEFIRYFHDIFSLALGLVIATTLVVGLLFKWLFPDLSWALAFAFGAIISPPDAIATTIILKRFAISGRLRTILEGESLINDASGLVIYRFAVVAIMTGSFSLKAALFQGFYVVVGGIVIGLALGYIFNKISSILNPVLSVAHSFVIPYTTYCIADYLGASGVLAVVSCGLLGARILITQFNPLARVLGWASWDIVIILLNCFIFMLIGLEFRHVLERMPIRQIGLYTGYGILITLAIIATRFIWIYLRRGFWLLQVIRDPLKAKESKLYLRNATLSSWAGMRGIVSLTAALALPLSLPNGIPLAGRDIVIFLTFEVIFLTLVIPSLTFPMLIRWFGMKPNLSKKELLQTRNNLAEIALNEIHRLHSLKHLDVDEMELLKMYFNSRHKIAHLSSISEEHIIEQARHRIIQKQREYLVELWLNNEINDSILSHLERELDIEESHLARGEMP